MRKNGIGRWLEEREPATLLGTFAILLIFYLLAFGWWPLLDHKRPPQGCTPLCGLEK